ELETPVEQLVPAAVQSWACRKRSMSSATASYSPASVMHAVVSAGARIAPRTGDRSIDSRRRAERRLGLTATQSARTERRSRRTKPSDVLLKNGSVVRGEQPHARRRGEQ